MDHEILDLCGGRMTLWVIVEDMIVANYMIVVVGCMAGRALVVMSSMSFVNDQYKVDMYSVAERVVGSSVEMDLR